MKAVVAAFNQEKALVGAFSVTNLRMELFEALVLVTRDTCPAQVSRQGEWLVFTEKYGLLTTQNGTQQVASTTPPLQQLLNFSNFSINANYYSQLETW